jgi:ATP-dependent RNA helicase RhlE
VREENYTHPTPIQAQAIPSLLEGRDLLGCARTGTGKTAAFVLPILQRLAASGPRSSARSARALILVPTRELAAQVRESLVVYGRHLKSTTAVVYGGVGQGPQVRALSKRRRRPRRDPRPAPRPRRAGPRAARRVEILVLDEADQMLDLGFLPAMKKILRMVPARRQTLLFSATMPPAIAALADGILTKPVRVFVTPAASTVEEVEQTVHFVEASGKAALLAEVLSDPAVERALVFTRTKRGADRVARGLVQRGIRAEAIHGNKSQNARERALEGFRRGRTPILVATDIAARGIDVEGITHVVNYEIPNVPESYVHRIGRTARAGATGDRDLLLRRSRARVPARHRAPDPAGGARRRRLAVASAAARRAAATARRSAARRTTAIRSTGRRASATGTPNAADTRLAAAEAVPLHPARGSSRGRPRAPRAWRSRASLSEPGRGCGHDGPRR